MGLFNQTFLIGPKDGSRLEEVTALVDTGSIYPMLPSSFLMDAALILLDGHRCCPGMGQRV